MLRIIMAAKKKLYRKASNIKLQVHLTTDGGKIQGIDFRKVISFFCQM